MIILVRSDSSQSYCVVKVYNHELEVSQGGICNVPCFARQRCYSD